MVDRYWCHVCSQMVMEVQIKCPFCESEFMKEMDCRRKAESVQMIVGELEENIKEWILTAGGRFGVNMTLAKMVSIACDVCKPDDVENLANFAVSEPSSIDILKINKIKKLKCLTHYLPTLT